MRTDPEAAAPENLDSRLQARRRRLRKLMRPLPRRSNLARYPILKYFAGPARRLPFLWSYRPEHVRPSLYIGSILTLLPLIGVQLFLVFVACVFLRGNLPIAAALQFISNPLTAAPLYGLTYAVGLPIAQWIAPGAEAAVRIPTSLGFGAVVLGLVMAAGIHLAWELTRRRRLRERALLVARRRQNRAPTSEPNTA